MGSGYYVSDSSRFAKDWPDQQPRDAKPLSTRAKNAGVETLGRDENSQRKETQAFQAAVQLSLVYGRFHIDMCRLWVLHGESLRHVFGSSGDAQR